MRNGRILVAVAVLAATVMLGLAGTAWARDPQAYTWPDPPSPIINWIKPARVITQSSCSPFSACGLPCGFQIKTLNSSTHQDRGPLTSNASPTRSNPRMLPLATTAA